MPELSPPVVKANAIAAESTKSLGLNKLSAKERAKRIDCHPKDQKMKMKRFPDEARNTSLQNVNSTRSQSVKIKGKSQSNLEAENPSDVAVISQTALDILRSSALSNSKASSLQTSVKYKPAHVNAPFRTIPQTKLAAKTIHTQKSLGHSRPLSSMQSTNVSLKEPRNSNTNSNNVVANAKIRRSKTSYAVTDRHSTTSNQIETDLTEQRIDEVLSKASFDENCNHQICSNTVECNPDAAQVEVQDTRFHLLRDGSSMKLPSKLSQALSKNYQFHVKLKSSTERQRRIRDGESSSKNFCELLQRHIDDSNSGSSSCAVQSKQCNRISDVLLWLRQLLDLATSVDVSDNSSAEVIVQVHKIIEYVLGEFSRLADVMQSVCLGSWPSEFKGGGKTIVTPNQKDFVLKWFLNDQLEEVKLIQSQRINYQSEQQLLKFTTLVHQVQLLQTHRMILESVESNAIALLNQLSSNDRLFPLLYQSFYSLVFSFGCSFPAIVKVIGDDEG